MKKARHLTGLSQLIRDGRTYFCCWAGLSAGFAGLSWVCCCGVAGVGFARFCGSDAEIVTFVMVISFHEKKHSNFHFPPQLCIASVQTRGPVVETVERGANEPPVRIGSSPPK
jgi:hypothetical protein